MVGLDRGTDNVGTVSARSHGLGIAGISPEYGLYCGLLALIGYDMRKHAGELADVIESFQQEGGAT